MRRPPRNSLLRSAKSSVHTVRLWRAIAGKQLHWRAPERVLADSARAALILERVRAIPKGFVQAYSDIDPHAPRFVGHVLSAGSPNVPWHRVVRSDGTVACG